MTGIVKAILESKAYSAAREGLDSGKRCQVSGLNRAAKAAWLAGTFRSEGNSVLLIVPDAAAAQFFADNLTAYLGSEEVLQFPRLSLLPINVFDYNPEVVSQRIRVLARLSTGQPTIVIAEACGITRKLLPPAVFAQTNLQLAVGDDWNFNELASKLLDLGYTREKLVDMPGSYSIRGSILDIYALGEDEPTRIEFFDTQIESLRYFDCATQRSGGLRSEALHILPCRELPCSGELLQAALPAIEREVQEMRAQLHGQAAHNLDVKYGALIEKIKQGIWTNEMESFFSHFYADGVSLVDYLAAQDLIVLDEPDEIKSGIGESEQERHNYYYDLLEAGQVLPSFNDNFFEFSQLAALLRTRRLLGFAQLTGEVGFDFQVQLTTLSRGIPSCVGKLAMLQDLVKGWQKEHFEIYFAAGSKIRAEKIRELLADYEIRGATVAVTPLTEGFESLDWHLAVVSEHELLGREHKPKVRRKNQSGQILDSFMDLSVGDYVVHLNHGIGRYMGVERITTLDVTRDYMKIEYAAGDKLFVPVDQMNMVQKYIGNDGNPPKLYKLGGNSWEKAKSRARKSVQDMTEELLELYASRESQKGFAFPPDSNWQQEFEDAFEFTETPDQLQAIDEIKADMERERPMDRLLCGDVGYGKTEVAIRAAFKAVLGGKQVAMLVPTTLLAEQHGRTFEARMASFPVRVGVISRFVTAKEQKKLLERLADGSLDIIIGTHRLLSKDIKFHDLGLLIVDEEQRFGVAHKEKIKQLRNNVDVLTLSATPIPRTLHMSLVGMRDMSVINTPPEDRFPVQTYVLEFNPRLLQEAIQQELKRGGQVYFIHNKVEDIREVAALIEKLVPEARVGFAHGQMKEQELEQSMGAFIDGELDVLVCTTIAESGLDIANVNTLFVHDSDCFGLAQLYQLRGRVGRSTRQAYAYFTYEPNKILSDVAKSRLKAIRDFTELGAGFKIAMRDMEIRGAGNILGAQQHGHIAAVGFEMYCRLVQQAIEGGNVMTDEAEKEVMPTLDLAINAYIPDTYVDNTDLKIEVYKRIAGVQSLEALAALREELAERFGKPPLAVTSLLWLGAIKYQAMRLHIAAIARKKGNFELAFRPDHKLQGEHLVALAQRYATRISYANAKDFTIIFKLFDLPDDAACLQALDEMLSYLYLQVASSADSEAEDRIIAE